MSVSFALGVEVLFELSSVARGYGGSEYRRPDPPTPYGLRRARGNAQKIRIILQRPVIWHFRLIFDGL